MKARLVLDQYCDLSKVTEENRSKVAFRPNPRGKAEAIYPAGTEFEGEMALLLCRTGQATPSDEECATKLGYTPEQLKAVQVEYKMNALGINRKEDRELYRAGVILGYDEKLRYIPGPNWDAYQKAVAQAQDGDDV